jgi:trk system potassium uptake protein TrkH
MREVKEELNDIRAEVSGWKLAIGYLGFITVIIGLVILVPVVMTIAFPSDIVYAKDFLIAGLTAVALGITMALFIFKKPKGKLGVHHDAFIVTFTWIIAVLFGALPYITAGRLNFSQAVFEATSMWTTTGMSASEFTAENPIPKIFLFHRSTMQFFGGAGLILVAVTLFGSLHGMKIFNAEGHADKLLPHIAKSSKLIFGIYSAYMLLGMLAYLPFGMNWFEALCNSMSSIATGGGACTPGGIADYDNVGIEIVTIVIMLTGSTSFLAHLYILRGKFKNVARSSEVRFFCAFIVLASLTGVLYISGRYSGGEAVRRSVFNVVSAVTTTGFQTAEFTEIMSAAPAFFALMICCMLLGGQNGSTSGGLKHHRAVVVVKDFWWSLRGMLGSPRVVRVNKVNKVDRTAVVDDKERSGIYTFIALYLIIFLFVALIVMLNGYGFGDSLFYAASSVGNTGLTAGVIPSAAPGGVLWAGTVSMLLGRLEIYIVIFAFFKIGKDAAGAISERRRK